MTSRSVGRTLYIGIVSALLFAPVHAQSQRDPTMPPISALVPERAASAVAATDEMRPLSVLIRDGRAFVVVGTRLYAPGQWLGSARIERITETEVWLREGKQLRKVQLFAGIQRSVATGSSGGRAKVHP